MPPQLVHQHEDAERIADEQRHTVPSVLMIGEVQRRTAPFVKMTEEVQRHTAPFVRTIGEVQKHNAFFVLMIGEAQRHTAFFVLMIGEVQSAKDTLHPLQWASVRTHEGITDIMPELSRPTCCAAEQSNHRLHATEASYSKSTQHKVTTRLHAVRKLEARASEKKEERNTQQINTPTGNGTLSPKTYIYVWQLVLPLNQAHLLPPPPPPT